MAFVRNMDAPDTAGETVQGPAELTRHLILPWLEKHWPSKKTRIAPLTSRKPDRQW